MSICSLAKERTRMEARPRADVTPLSFPWRVAEIMGHSKLLPATPPFVQGAPLRMVARRLFLRTSCESRLSSGRGRLRFSGQLSGWAGSGPRELGASFASLRCVWKGRPQSALF